MALITEETLISKDYLGPIEIAKMKNRNNARPRKENWSRQKSCTELLRKKRNGKLCGLQHPAWPLCSISLLGVVQDAVEWEGFMTYWGQRYVVRFHQETLPTKSGSHYSIFINVYHVSWLYITHYSYLSLTSIPLFPFLFIESLFYNRFLLLLSFEPRLFIWE